ncbi:hypothetical protein MKZ38_006426 [Zalerion maritima]|uniref:C2H2-type domain-containing protein n=1 Tax=Zalerion maritima TaxID=339359 RepID=A0AAD5RJH8_9PEZI|nr:hypothetical protein MKZ38_006426 [Zalerion maritima]
MECNVLVARGNPSPSENNGRWEDALADVEGGMDAARTYASLETFDGQWLDSQEDRRQELFERPAQQIKSRRDSAGTTTDVSADLWNLPGPWVDAQHIVSSPPSGTMSRLLKLSPDSGYGSVFDASNLVSPQGNSSPAIVSVTDSWPDGKGGVYPPLSPAISPYPNPPFSDNRYKSVSNRPSLAVKQRCPYPDCGKRFKDLKAHMVGHQTERPEKCPVPSCDYHVKGFARKYDCNRHTLTHFKSVMVCGFCPGYASGHEKQFNRADVFKRHLTAVHGVEQCPPNSRKPASGALNPAKSSVGFATTAAAKCSVCDKSFRHPQDFYEHLDDCILRMIVPRSSDSNQLKSRAVGIDLRDLEGKKVLDSSDGMLPGAPASTRPTSNDPPPSSTKSCATAMDITTSESPNQELVVSPSPSASESSNSGSDSGTSSVSPLSMPSLAQRRKEVIVDSLIERLVACLNAKIAVLGYQAQGTGSFVPTAGSTSGRQSFPTGTPSEGKNNKRRKPSGGTGRGGDESDDDKHEGNERPRKKLKEDPSIPCRFACPFYKHDKRKYQTQHSCVWSGYETVHRVKEHLYRRHLARRFRCLRCGEDMKTHENLCEHHQSAVPCTPTALSLEEGVTVAQEQELRSRRRRKISEPEKWVEMYKILFPGEDIPSPYHEPPIQHTGNGTHDASALLEGFERYASYEFPRLMRPELDVILNGALLEQLSSDSVVAAANVVLQRLIQTFERDHVALGSTDCNRSTSRPSTSLGSLHATSDAIPQVAPVDTTRNPNHTNNYAEASSHTNYQDITNPLGQPAPGTLINHAIYDPQSINNAAGTDNTSNSQPLSQQIGATQPALLISAPSLLDLDFADSFLDVTLNPFGGIVGTYEPFWATTTTTTRTPKSTSSPLPPPLPQGLSSISATAAEHSSDSGYGGSTERNNFSDSKHSRSELNR